jgi:REP-associated tyrosine transposase
MPEYRRNYQAGGTYFITIITEKRLPIFENSEARDCLHLAFEKTRKSHPFIIDACVLLFDHIHFLISLPEADTDYSKRIGLIKRSFSQCCKERGLQYPNRNESKISKRESGFWQRRFWEHTIRGEEDFKNHLDYIHYNPVKHGLVRCSHAWPHSTLNKWTERGEYSSDWLCECNGGRVVPLPHLIENDSAGE